MPWAYEAQDLIMFLSPTEEPKDHCARIPRRLCITAFRAFGCRCKKCVSWNKAHLEWRKGQSREARLAECLKWRKKIGLARDETRNYGGVSDVTYQTVVLADPPICPKTGAKAGDTNCGCRVCKAYAQYYFEITNEKLLPAQFRGIDGKQCSRCKRYKSFENFYRDRTNGGFRSECKACNRR